MPIRALILAAGRGERMRPLSDDCPKPLLPVGGRPLIEWHLRALAAAGVVDVVINTAWLEERFPAVLGDGSRFGLRIHYSFEQRDHGGALETAGGIAKALPLLAPNGDEPFWVVSGDVHVPGFDFGASTARRFAQTDDDAWLWLVDNPDFKSGGDFALEPDGRLSRPADPMARKLTYANLALVRPRLVASVLPGTRAALGPLLFTSADAGRLRGLRLTGDWDNLGTPSQWAALDARLRATSAAVGSGA
jgi:MurNAc alpha-1-phosphate uridylyltransferase